ncbi:VOC family protein [Pseudolactococcus carnosus]|uniref:VOC family protein n=1 Tax=Pseudolactococcus carnosus TaxID=2749961 RepID=UPI001FB89D8E|nr:VOC family protein [Lactococcus carnosus]MCJ2002552.1 VOC family protein [Lactococcus carnosus]
MLDHIDIKVRHLEQSKVFYSTLLAVLGIAASYEDASSIIFSDSKDYIWIGEGIPKRVHFAFSAKDMHEVNAFYQVGLACGGKSAGEPSYQGDDYYSCYILDLDNYLIEAVCRQVN